MAEFFEVAESTINAWKKAFPEFSESIKRGKAQADAEVAEKLFHRAKGYEHPETKVFCHEGVITTHEVVKHYPPDTGAAMAWLKNRRRKADVPWQDSHDITSGGEKIEPQVVSFLDATKPQNAGKNTKKSSGGG
ncbi:MAG: helix-turn-helix domain-containing protein [Planctomycetota bacterium]